METIKRKRVNNRTKWTVGMITTLTLAIIIYILYVKFENNENSKITIIVPVYNVEEYIPTCLENLINQTYSNIEIICVNDGSTDKSPAVLNEYKEKDNRIKIIDKENGGVSSARNVGIKESNGDYIAFVDTDDYIDLDVCKKA